MMPCQERLQCPVIRFPAATYRAYNQEADLVERQLWYGSLIEEKSDDSGLMYMRNRYYNPATGSFTQEDPIGIAGGLNTYRFANGDPATYDDPYGLCPPCAPAVATAPQWAPAVATGAKVVVTGAIALIVGRLMPQSNVRTGIHPPQSAQRDGTAWASDFVVTPRGTAVPVSQQRMQDGFDAAGFPKQPTISPGLEYTLPDGRRVRTMEPAGQAPRRASFENANQGPVTPNGTVPQPPRGMTKPQRQQYVRDRTHVEQTP